MCGYPHKSVCRSCRKYAQIAPMADVAADRGRHDRLRDRSARQCRLGRWPSAALASLSSRALCGRGEVGRSRGQRRDSRHRRRTDCRCDAASLRSEIEKQRRCPLVLSQDPDARRALLAGSDAGAFDRLNDKLEDAGGGHAAPPSSMSSTRDGHRDFRQQLARTDELRRQRLSFPRLFPGGDERGQAEQFALGTVSGRPGLYISPAASTAAPGPLGVVVVKVEFDDVEARLERSGGHRPTSLTNAASC